MDILLVEIVEKKKQDVVEYMNEHFTKEEARRHLDNIYNLLMSKGDIALYEMQKLSKNA